MCIRCLQVCKDLLQSFFIVIGGHVPRVFVPSMLAGETPQPCALLDSCPRSTSACTSPYSSEAHDQGLYSTHKILQGGFGEGAIWHHLTTWKISSSFQSMKPFKVQIQPFCNLGTTTFVLYAMEGLLLWALPHTKRDLCSQNGIPINRERSTWAPQTNLQKSNF
jgi:hypothetical protein